MGFFQRLFFGGPPKPPRWGAPFGTLERFEAFLDWLQEELENRGIPQLSKVLRTGGFVVKLPKKNVTLVLEGLARECATSDDPVLWGRALDGLLAAQLGRPDLHSGEAPVLRPAPTLPAQGEAAPDFESVAGQLRVQLYSPKGLAGLGLSLESVVHQSLHPELHAVLLWEQGGRAHFVPLRFAEAWQREAQTLIDRGWQNVRQTEAVQQQTLEGPEGLQGQLVAGAGHYAAAWVARISPPEGERWPEGVLLALSCEHAAAFHPVRRGQAMAAYAWLAGLSIKLHDEYDHPISDTIWWRQGAQFIALPIRRASQDQVSHELLPAPEFIERFRAELQPSPPPPDEDGGESGE